MVRFAKCSARDSVVRVSVCRIKVVSHFFPSGCTFKMLKFGKTDISFAALKSPATRSAASG
jgi:hypothetical protein